MSAKGIIINNGVDVDPRWTDRILVTEHYEGDTPLTNITSALAAGGSLIPAQEYFYLIVARCDKHIVVAGDGGSQLSALDLDVNSDIDLYWRLTQVGGTTRVDLARNSSFSSIVAVGTRTGDGVVLLEQRNESGVSGTVTVTYASDDVGVANTIKVRRNVEVGVASDEVSETATGANKSVDLAWDILNTAFEYRIYRGTATGIYDRYFTTTSATFTDDGTLEAKFDLSIRKSNITEIADLFSPEKVVNGDNLDSISKVYLIFTEERRSKMYNLKKVTNQATWNLGTQAATTQAKMDIESWIV